MTTLATPRWRIAVALVSLLALHGTVLAQEAAPGPRPDQQFDFMNLLTQHGLHDQEDESWNAYGQITEIISFKPGFPAAYSNLHGSTASLLASPEWSFTATATLYLAVRLWPGAEAYFVPEIIAERPFSQLHGLGAAIQNFELQKGGSQTPQLYRSRAYLRQVVGLGGGRTSVESNPMQLGTTYDRRRLVFVLGNFSILDFFDRNAFGIDPRQGFFSLAYLTYGAYDFASDARGYSWGGVAELTWDDWAVRVARITPPQQPNQLPVDFRLDQYYGDQIELEHQHRLGGLDGRVRLLAYRDRAWMGRFSDAIASFQAVPSQNAANCPGFSYGSQNVQAPDLCWVRRPNAKMGIGLYADQHLTPALGVFMRGMISDGQSEVEAYTSTDRSLSAGLLGHGALWGRPADVAGIGGNLGWVSAAHARYLELGGVDGFIGDGALRPAVEVTGDAFYSVNVWSSVWLSGDYQAIVNPGFNADRGPVSVFGARIHGEF